MAIISFTDDRLADFFYDGAIPMRAGWASASNQVLVKLDRLHSATRISDMAYPPGNNLHRLEGNLKGFHAVRINRQWRLIFKWEDGNAFEVDVLDYH